MLISRHDVAVAHVKSQHLWLLLKGPAIRNCNTDGRRDIDSRWFAERKGYSSLGTRLTSRCSQICVAMCTHLTCPILCHLYAFVSFWNFLLWLCLVKLFTAFQTNLKYRNTSEAFMRFYYINRLCNCQNYSFLYLMYPSSPWLTKVYAFILFLSVILDDFEWLWNSLEICLWCHCDL